VLPIQKSKFRCRDSKLPGIANVDCVKLMCHADAEAIVE